MQNVISPPSQGFLRVMIVTGKGRGGYMGYSSYLLPVI